MRLPLTFWLLLALSAFGVETVAWRVPLELVIEGGLKHPEVKRLEKPPAASAFCEAEDVLWQLPAELIIMVPKQRPEGADPFVHEEPVPNQFPFEGEFLIWNQTQQRIVARGSCAEIALVELWLLLIRFQTTVRLHLEVEDGERTHRLHLASPSGERSRIEQDGIHGEFTAFASERGRFIDVTTDLEIPSGTTAYRIQTGLTLIDGQTIHAARWENGDTRLNVRISAKSEYFWGVPTLDVRSVDGHPRASNPEPLDQAKLDNLKPGDGIDVRVLSAPPVFIEMLVPDAAPGCPWNLPEPLKPVLPADWTDLRPALEANGVSFDSDLAVAGMHPRTGEVVAIATPTDLDLIESIAMSCTYDPPLYTSSSIRWPDGMAMIATRSGEKASIQRKNGDDFQTLYEVAPVVTASEESIDLAVRLLDPEASLELDTTATLLDGIPSKIAEEETAVTLTGTIRVMDH